MVADDRSSRTGVAFTDEIPCMCLRLRDLRAVRQLDHSLTQLGQPAPPAGLGDVIADADG